MFKIILIFYKIVHFIKFTATYVLICLKDFDSLHHILDREDFWAAKNIWLDEMIFGRNGRCAKLNAVYIPVKYILQIMKIQQ